MTITTFIHLGERVSHNVTVKVIGQCSVNVWCGEDGMSLEEVVGLAMKEIQKDPALRGVEGARALRFDRASRILFLKATVPAGIPERKAEADPLPCLGGGFPSLVV